MSENDKTILCEFTGAPAVYRIGYARYDERHASEFIGYVATDQVDRAIDHVMAQLLGTRYWVSVHDLEDNLLYHSYDADQNGMGAKLGWDHYLRTNNLT